MSRHMRKSPDFVSRAEAGERLMLSTRQIDRLIKAGELAKVKVSANRSGIPRGNLEAYIASRAGDVGVPAGVPVARRTHHMLQIELEEPVASAIDVIDEFLGQRFPGCLVTDGGGGRMISVIWAWSLDYSADKIKRALEAAASMPLANR